MIVRIGKKAYDFDLCVYLFIAALFVLPLYISFMFRMSGLFGFDTKVTTYLYYGALWMLLLLSMSRILNSLTRNLLIGAMGVLFFLVFQYLAFPDNRKYIIDTSLMPLVTFSTESLSVILLYFFVGNAVKDMEKLCRIFHTAARIGTVLGAAGYIVAILSGAEIRYDDMGNAYAISVVVCYLIVNRQKHDIIYIILGAFALILAGTRGPIVCVFVAFCLKSLILQREARKKIFGICMVFLVLLLLNSELLLLLAEKLSEFFAMLGIEELRFVDYIREGMLTYTSGRDQIMDNLFDKIEQKPFWGYGVGGDRQLLSRSAYAHNLVVEMWVSFGLVGGSAIIAWMAYYLFRGMLSRNAALQRIVVAFFSAFAIQLMLSNSYLQSKGLFILLGLCYSGLTLQKRQTLEQQKRT